MTTYVRAIYDFSGEPGSSEISITVGDILTLTRTDVGEGWWEGKTSQGRVGLFPAAYVETVSAAEVARPIEQPPPVLRYDQTPDANDEDADSDWDDDWDSDRTYAKVGQPKGDAYDNKHLPVAPSEDTVSMTSSAMTGGAAINATTLKKTSMFGKSSDSYILGLATRDKLPESEIVHIVQVDNFYYWQANHQAYTVVVASPKKESKFKGMKTFIAYQLTPSFNNISVSRRYKHFDWLHERLEEKFCLIPIPPLPDKQISGRYEEQFVEHRRVQLQEFVDWVCRHPVLSRCEVWYHFLTCTDDKIWKAGKRKAERDPFVGVTYCLAISPPEKHLLQSQVDGQMESCSLFVHAMDSSVKNLLAISNEAAKRNQLQCKKEFQRIGDGFADLAKALIIDEQRAPATTAKPLSTSVARIGAVFIDIGKIYGDQAKSDWTSLSDRLHIYRGVLNSFPSILSTHKDAMQQRKECERIAGERGNNVQMVDVNRRTDVVSYAVMAEMSHFKQERDGHMRHSLRAFVEEQIKFYSNVVAKLQEALVDIP